MKPAAKPDVHFLAAVPYVIGDRQLVTFPCVAGGRLVRCAICGAALAVLWDKPVRAETGLGEAFAACRGRVEALVRRLLAEGRGAGGGLCIMAEDVTGAEGPTPTLNLRVPAAV